jgi:hypothetical protein
MQAWLFPDDCVLLWRSHHQRAGFMNYTLPITALVAVLGLSGCAASLVYDRDRPAARDCSDPQKPCLDGAGQPGFIEQYQLAGAPDQLGLSRRIR